MSFVEDPIEEVTVDGPPVPGPGRDVVLEYEPAGTAAWTLVLPEVPDQRPFDLEPDGCWADNGDFVSCNRLDVDEVGLCPDHRAELSGPTPG